MRRQNRSSKWALLPAIAIVLAGALGTPGAARADEHHQYENPLLPAIPGGGAVESCADPSTIYAEGTWYTYCTTDPLNDAETADGSAAGDFHKIPMLSSSDLLNWTYEGDAFASPPAWAHPEAGMWAPEIEVIGGTYYLFYGITDTADSVSGVPGCDRDNAIGYATGPTPLGPWTDSGEPLIGPRQNGTGCEFFWTYDPEVVDTNGDAPGGLLIYYGSYYGGIHAQPIEFDGEGVLQPVGGSTPITIPNRYEGAEVAFNEDTGYWYLFVSAANCCNGPLTGYSVFVGRSTSPLGPFVDREGVSFLQGRVGGTPFLSMNGNRWVGPGHNSVFVDFDDQWWTTYHAIDRFDPYYEGLVGFTKRPLMLDPIDWVDGWPTVRGGHWISDDPMPAPAAQPGETTAYEPTFVVPDQPGAVQGYATDNFTSRNLHPRWEWVREPAASEWGIEDGMLRFETQPADLFVDSNNASVLLTDAPKHDYMVETRVRLTLPEEGCCFNYVQAGLVIYGDDDNFIKLTQVSIWETRQTEFAKEVAPVPAGYPRYGNTVVGPPGDWIVSPTETPQLETWLRIVKRTVGEEEHYTAYTSTDGTTWVRGGTWTHELGEGQQIGLVSMGGDGFTAYFDYVRTTKLR